MAEKRHVGNGKIAHYGINQHGKMEMRIFQLSKISYAVKIALAQASKGH